MTFADFLAARRRVKLSALREVAVEAPRVAWDDVGGHAAIKQQLREAVEWQERHGDALRRVGAVPPAGTLLYGPRGARRRCWRARWRRRPAATSSPSPARSCTASTWASRRRLCARSSAARRRVRALGDFFGRAGRSRRAPVLPFGRRRAERVGPRPHAAARRDGRFGERIEKRVRRRGDEPPDLVDPALACPGRFDRALYVPPPTEWEDRAAILRRAARKTPPRRTPT